MPTNPEQILAAQIASLAWRALAESGEASPMSDCSLLCAAAEEKIEATNE